MQQDTIPNDLLWIQAAAIEFKRSRDWLENQPSIKKYTIPGDKRKYVSRSEVEKAIQPKEAN